MGGKHRMVLGRYQDARLGAENLLGAADAAGERLFNHVETCRTGRENGEYKRMVNAFVARVRRRFGDKYAKVALAYIHGRHWSKTGIPRPTFYYALKKIEKSFGADKHWSKLRSARRRKARRLD